jgi:uncharacterized protein YegL
MPKLFNQETTVAQTVSNFSFTAARPDTLGSSEYTLVSIALDRSGSVEPFKGELIKAYKEIIGACRKNPRAENILVRATSFNSSLKEEHGFINLDAIDENSFDMSPYGGTALYDSALESVEAAQAYGQKLTDLDFLVNGLVVIVTDGEENSSRTASPAKIKATLDAIKKSEKMESVKVILIGLGADGNIAQYLNVFKDAAGFDQFEHIKNTDAKGLAKMANFISKSISSSSNSLGTGGPSVNLSI